MQLDSSLISLYFPYSIRFHNTYAISSSPLTFRKMSPKCHRATIWHETLKISIFATEVNSVPNENLQINSKTSWKIQIYSFHRQLSRMYLCITTPHNTIVNRKNHKVSRSFEFPARGKQQKTCATCNFGRSQPRWWLKQKLSRKQQLQNNHEFKHHNATKKNKNNNHHNNNGRH